MKVILFSLLALSVTPALKADYGDITSYDKRYRHPAAHGMNDTQFNVRMEPAIFDKLVTQAINTPNTNTDPLQELLLRINTGKITHKLSSKYTRITHKDFYHRLLPYIPFNYFFYRVARTTSDWTYLIKLNDHEAFLDVTIWGNAVADCDERVRLFMKPVSEIQNN
jgi:hypothetical protein